MYLYLELHYLMRQLRQKAQMYLVGYGPWGCKESDRTEAPQHALYSTDAMDFVCTQISINAVVGLRSEMLLLGSLTL